MQAERYREAATICESAWRAGGDPADAARAARALRSLGDLNRVLEWSARLGGEAPEVELEKGQALLAAGRTEEGLDAIRRAAALFDRGNKAAAASTAYYELSVKLWDIARYGESLAATQTSIERARAAGDARGEKRSLVGLSVDLFEVGDLVGSSRALELARRDLEAGRRPHALRPQSGREAAGSRGPHSARP